MPDSDTEAVDFGDDEVYKARTNRTLEEIKKLDQEDESLRRYKEALLGPELSLEDIPFPNNPKVVVVDKFIILITGYPDVVLDLQGDLSQMKKNPVQIPEGVEYRIQVYYYVQREIVSGLRYKQVTSRLKVVNNRSTVMLGSYRPQKDVHIWTSEPDETPKGALYRGTYTVKSTFTDDLKTDYLTWEWAISVTSPSSSS